MGKLFGFDIAGGKINIKGSGKPLITFTARPDIASYLAYVLTSLPREKLEWRSFCIEGDRIVSYYKPISQLNAANIGYHVVAQRHRGFS